MVPWSGDPPTATSRPRNWTGSGISCRMSVSVWYDRPGVLDHLVDGHGQRVLVPVKRHVQTVPDARDIDSGPLRPGCGQAFADRHHRQPLTRRLLRGKVRNGQSGAPVGLPISLHRFRHAIELQPGRVRSGRSDGFRQGARSEASFRGRGPGRLSSAGIRPQNPGRFPRSRNRPFPAGAGIWPFHRTAKQKCSEYLCNISLYSLYFQKMCYDGSEGGGIRSRIPPAPARCGPTPIQPTGEVRPAPASCAGNQAREPRRRRHPPAPARKCAR